MPCSIVGGLRFEGYSIFGCITPFLAIGVRDGRLKEILGFGLGPFVLKRVVLVAALRRRVRPFRAQCALCSLGWAIFVFFRATVFAGNGIHSFDAWGLAVD